MTQIIDRITSRRTSRVRGVLKEGTLFIAFVLAVLCFPVSGIPVLAGSGMGGSPASIFYKANSYYEEGRYDNAIEEYSRLLDQGIESGNLYFNLGNSYFKKGELGRAVLQYERARRLIPRDGDLKANYSFARSKIPSRVSAEPSWLTRVLRTFTLFTLDELTVILSAIGTSVLLYLTAGIFTHKLRRFSASVLFICLLLFLLFGLSLTGKISSLDREAVITAVNAEARFEPMESATTHFTLYEGMKVSLLDTKKEWKKIKRQDGKVGWVKEEALEKI